MPSNSYSCAFVKTSSGPPLTIIIIIIIVKNENTQLTFLGLKGLCSFARHYVHMSRIVFTVRLQIHIK